MHFAYPLTENTELRVLEPRHAEDLYALIDRNREHLGRWLSWASDDRSSEEWKAVFQRRMREFGEQGHFLAGIWHDGTLAGVIQVNSLHPDNRSTSLMYYLDKEFQGGGLATRACRAVISHAFSVLQAHRIEILAATGNARSRAIAERLGFTHEGTQREAYRLPDGFVDLEAYAVLEEEWEPRESIAFSCSLTNDAELRLLQPHYAEEIFTLADCNRAHLRHEGWIDDTHSVDDIRDFIRHLIQGMADETEVNWGIWHRGHFAGIIGTPFMNRQARRAEIGYWLGEEFQGKGLMTAAGRAMLDYLFTTLDLNRAELRIRTNNARSLAVAERLGFTREGIQRQVARSDGHLVDMALYALLREEWACNT